MIDTKKNLITKPTRRTVLTGMAAAGAATALPSLNQYAYAGSDAPIKIGFQVHRTGIGAAYWSCHGLVPVSLEQ